MSDLVGNPEYRFSHNEAHIYIYARLSAMRTTFELRSHNGSRIMPLRILNGTMVVQLQGIGA